MNRLVDLTYSSLMIWALFMSITLVICVLVGILWHDFSFMILILFGGFVFAGFVSAFHSDRNGVSLWER